MTQYPLFVILPENPSPHEPVIFDPKALVTLSPDFSRAEGTGEVLIERRCMSSRLFNKAFYLSKNFNWTIVRDDDGALCLVPTKQTK